MSRHSCLNAVAACALMLGMGNAVAERCVPVSGKITSNFMAQGTTLGAVSMIYGHKGGRIKLDCALSGIQQPSAPPQVVFIDSVSCDDSVSTPDYDGSGDVPVHSSIVLYSTAMNLPPLGPTQLFTFKETSVPMAGVPGRGLFFGVSGGHIDVDGVVYKGQDATVPGSINMTFTGEVCYPQ